jgi:ElaB/YqjD/DUF883 family membrane-anchored ribosome-binding protein
VEKSQKLDQLIDDSEELLIKLADAHNPEIQILRDRVDHAINDARRAIERESEDASIRLRDIAVTIDNYVHDYPWLALATGVMIAGSIAFIAGATLGTKRR